MEDEQFINGFCRAQNQTRMVTVVFEESGAGRKFIEADCAFALGCPHTDNCQIAAQMREDYGA